ncbi:MAG: PQQ-dependent sugar dehydrogenase [Erythrobacter sp.]
MMKLSKFAPALFLPALALSSCGNANSGDSASAGSEAEISGPVAFTTEEMGEFAEPWALSFAPGTETLFITEKPGTMKFVDTSSGKTGEVSGLPDVAYGGQGGLGDVAFLPSEADQDLSNRTIYLSWAEAGSSNTSGAVVGRGTLACGDGSCAISDLNVIWRQAPKTSRRGHYSHRIVFSPDEQYMFISSGDRQELEPAQDTANNLGTVVRLNLDGSTAQGNPFYETGGITAEIWSYGHRNVLGLGFAPDGQLWDLEHGPAGGDEFNRVERGANYGWPTVSDGNHYNGDPIPEHASQPEFSKAAIGWTPVIAPGDLLFYTGDAFRAWSGDPLMVGLAAQAIVHVEIDGDTAVEVRRYEFENRLRGIEQGPDGAVWLIEDGPGGRLLKLMPA